MFFAVISKSSPTHLLLPFLGFKSDDSSMLHGSSSSKNKMNSLFISPHANGGLGKATLSTQRFWRITVKQCCTTL